MYQAKKYATTLGQIGQLYFWALTIALLYLATAAKYIYKQSMALGRYLRAVYGGAFTDTVIDHTPGYNYTSCARAYGKLKSL